MIVRCFRIKTKRKKCNVARETENYRNKYRHNLTIKRLYLKIKNKNKGEVGLNMSVLKNELLQD